MLFPSFFNAQAGAYEIEQSLRFDGSSGYLSRTPGSAGNQQTWTFSVWLKRSKLTQVGIFCPVTGGDGSNESQLRIKSDNAFQVYDSGGLRLNRTSTRLFRDSSAWFHLVVAVDTTQATDTDRCKIYVNGSQITDESGTLPGQNNNLGWNGTSRHDIGRYAAGAEDYFDGYMAEMHHIDGTQLDPTDFGESDDNGVWRPIEYTGGSYGTNGFYLKFDPTATNGIGHDHSGNGNNWTASGFTTSGTGTDVMSDTPTTNYPTFNPVYQRPPYPTQTELGTLSNGNLDITFNGVNGGRGMTFAELPTSGKWYFEITKTGSVTSNVSVGLYGKYTDNFDNAWRLIASNANSLAYAFEGVDSGSKPSGSLTFQQGDVIGVQVDLDNNKFRGYVNGVGLTEATGLSFASYSPLLIDISRQSSSGSNDSYTVNFGQRDFTYTPPTGFKALNTANLPAPTVKDGSKNFNTVLYTGNGSTQSITGVGFNPDLVWCKSRNSNYHGALVDQVRGATKYLYSSLNIAEETQTTALSTFDSDGFSLNGSFSNVNNNGTTYAAWCWDAGGSGSSNTDGSITSTVSANPDAGFSIVTYTGTGSAATVGHGLGVQPSFYVVKPRSYANNWPCWHKDLTSDGYYIHLNLALKQDLATVVWNGTGPSSTVFNIGTNTNVNQQDATFVAYVFAEVEGYSRISSYSGNGSTDGPFVYCGFRPAFLLIKNYRGGSETNWIMRDSARSPYNKVHPSIYANTADSEINNFDMDFLSNGFKIKDDNAVFNESGSDYLFLAFAENPFGGSGVSPATAR